MDAVLVESSPQTIANPACSSPCEKLTAHSAEQAQDSARVPLAHAFTRETAATNARKAVMAREAKRKARLALASVNGDPYVQTRLSRTREQLERIDEMLKTEADPQKLDRLVSAQSRLSEQWRIFSGIPLPGSRRPGRETPAKRSGEVGPVE